MISHFDGRPEISSFAKEWLNGRSSWFDFSDWSKKELLVLWWDIAIFLHCQYAEKLMILESIMKHKGVKIPREEDELMQMVRLFD